MRFQRFSGLDRPRGSQDKKAPRALFMGETVSAALLALATFWDLHEYVHKVGLQPGHLTRHPVLTGGELQDGLLQGGQTAC